MEGQLQRVLGHSLRACRESRNLSQEAFAAELGYHRTYIGELERGNRNLSLRAVERLADQLDVDPLWLLEEDI